MMGEPFNVGDAVFLVPGRGGLAGASQTVVLAVRRNGNFTLAIDAPQQYRQAGYSTGDAWWQDSVKHSTPEVIADIAAAKAVADLQSHLTKVGKAILNAPADTHAAIAALLSDELLALLGVAR